MKKFIIGLGVVAMVMGMVASANASATDWLAYLKATDQDGFNGIATQNLYGTKTGAADAYDGINDAANAAGLGSSVVLGCFDLGSGLGLNGYSKDLRAPSTKLNTWNLKLYAQESCAATSFKVTFWNPTGNYGLPADGSLKYTLSVVGDSSKTFTFDGKTNGTSSAAQGTWIFDAKGHVGLANAYTLQITPSVPEPGSMVAMLSGLAGLVGFGIRRRK